MDLNHLGQCLVISELNPVVGVLGWCVVETLWQGLTFIPHFGRELTVELGLNLGLIGVYPPPYSLIIFLTCEEAGPLTFPTPGVFFFFKSRNSAPLSVDGRYVSWGVRELGRGMNVC